MTKVSHYFDIYDHYFFRFRDTSVRVLEIGVYKGGSLQMWKNYFGPRAVIYGVDIEPGCKKFEEDQIEIFIGDQSDRFFLEMLPEVDVVIDDGGHRGEQQITSMEVLLPKMPDGGIYICEDVHTSFIHKYGEYKNSVVSYVQEKLITGLHNVLNGGKVPFGIHGIHIYPGMVVIEKKAIEHQHIVSSGKE